jgi:NodT family efflux transporter outer membrane factor (OMF) lipoprotein
MCRAQHAALSRATPLILGLSLTACAVGPNYLRPAASVPTSFKELKGTALKGWKVATPGNEPGHGQWWVLYHDPELDLLIKQVEVSNQTVAADAAAYEEARALVREAQAALFPTLNASYSYNRTRAGPKASGGALSAGVVVPSGTGASGGGTYTTTIVPQLSGSWDLDVWGKVRRQIESNSAAAQASKAALDFAKLSAQAMLATAYFNLRAEDALSALLTRTIAEDQKTYTVVNNQFKAGFGTSPTSGPTKGDVAAAEAQVLSAQEQLVNVGVARAQDEHAIAMLIGRPPAQLTIGPRPLGGGIPRIPVTVPSTLLERRPDIAAAERTMQEQNALIGVAVAGYFPDISLSGTLEWIGKNPLPFNAASEIWSLGAAGTETLFNGGLTSAQVDAARATYWESVANYRQTVLTALQGVEDELSGIRLMSHQLALAERTVQQEHIAVDVSELQLQQGLVPYTTVATLQITLLGDEETALTVRQNLFLASVTLIEDLGGGWDTTLLPAQKELQQSFSLLPKLATQ